MAFCSLFFSLTRGAETTPAVQLSCARAFQVSHRPCIQPTTRCCRFCRSRQSKHPAAVGKQKTRKWGARLKALLAAVGVEGGGGGGANEGAGPGHSVKSGTENYLVGHVRCTQYTGICNSHLGCGTQGAKEKRNVCVLEEKLKCWIQMLTHSRKLKLALLC